MCERNQYEETVTPMIHEMSLRPGPFAAVAAGTKTVELRLYDPKRQAIRVGDTIRFTSTDSGASVLVSVRDIHVFRDFEELYDGLIPRVGAVGLGYTPGETVSPTDMLDYYCTEDIARHGVVGFEIEI